MQNNSIDIQKLIVIAKKAGFATLKFHKKIEPKDITSKVDESPVTAADFAAHEVIVDSLKKEYPGIPCLSEESGDNVFEQRKSWTRYFLVDPLDGTKEFIKGSDEFTVNIALIENGESVLGVIYQPVPNVLYYGDLNESFKETVHGKSSLPLAPYLKGKMRVVSSKSHKNAQTNEYIENLKSEYEVESLCYGSSLKICKVAEGLADLNPRLGGTSEWDIAAGHAILRGAGGDILLYGSRQRVCYNKESLLNPWYEAKRSELLNS